jgi:hypothetical protein
MLRSPPPQEDVETYYLAQGLLIQGFTPNYWLGLSTTSAQWPDFRWLSTSVPPPTYNTYEHWAHSEAINEPNNLDGADYCAVANSSLMESNAWGWADWNCTAQLPYICRVDGEQLCCLCSAALISSATGCAACHVRH